MKRFFNFRSFRKIASLVVYVTLLAMLMSDMLHGPDKNHQQYMTWWTLFLVMDIWFFGVDGFFEDRSKKD